MYGLIAMHKMSGYQLYSSYVCLFKIVQGAVLKCEECKEVSFFTQKLYEQIL